MHNFFVQFFPHINIDTSLFPVTFSRFDHRGLSKFYQKMPTKPYMLSKLDKPLELWSDREIQSIQKLFRNPTCDVKATLLAGKLVQSASSSSKNTPKSSQTSNKSTPQNQPAQNKFLYENDVRTLRSLKFMYEANDIKWSKLRFKTHPSSWSPEHLKQVEQILETPELLKTLLRYFDV